MTVQIRFRGESDGGSFTHDLAIDDVMVDEGPAFDVGISAVNTPVSVGGCGTPLTASEIITVTIDNFALVPLPLGSMVSVEYSVDGAPPVAETATVPATILPLQSFAYAFTTPVDLSAPGVHTITARTTVIDPVPMNDQTSVVVQSGLAVPVTTFPWRENFDNQGLQQGATTPPPCWQVDPANGSGVGPQPNWIFSNVEPSSLNGPPADRTTGVAGSGFFAYVEDGSDHPTVGLLTPPLDFTGVAYPVLSFWIHSNNDAMQVTLGENFLAVDVVDAAGNVLATDVVGPVGHLGSQWVEQRVGLDAFTGMVVRLRFRGQSDGDGNGATMHDVAIDDIEVSRASRSSANAGHRASPFSTSTTQPTSMVCGPPRGRVVRSSRPRHPERQSTFCSKVSRTSRSSWRWDR